MSENNRQVAVFRKPKDLMEYLQRSSASLKAALPKHLNPDRMLRLAVTCFSQTPALQQCSGQSILASIIVAGQLGLEPGIAGQGYLVPYKGTCTFVPGWQGLVGLLNNTGRATAWTDGVFEGDHFKFAKGSAPVLEHEPGENYGDPNALIWAYACGKVNGSETPIIEAWPMKRVFRHRDRYNKQGKAHYSYNQPEAYARKVVLLQVLKYLPRSVELSNALAAANAEESGRAVRYDDGVVVEVESTAAEEQEPNRPEIPEKTMPDARQAAQPSTPPPASTLASPAQATPADPSEPGVIPDGQLSAEITRRLVDFEISDAEIVAWAKGKGLMKPEQRELAELSTAKLRSILTGLYGVTQEILNARDAAEEGGQK